MGFLDVCPHACASGAMPGHVMAQVIFVCYNSGPYVHGTCIQSTPCISDKIVKPRCLASSVSETRQAPWKSTTRRPLGCTRSSASLTQPCAALAILRTRMSNFTDPATLSQRDSWDLLARRRRSHTTKADCCRRF